MKIGILGAGNIGGNLGRRWADKGHVIRFGVREPGALDGLVKECGHGASAGDVRSAVAHGDVIVLALPWNAVEGALGGAGDLAGKILVDATNAVAWKDGPTPAIHDGSGAERVQALARGARVVKAYNTLGAEHIMNPVVDGQAADVFLATDDDAARKTVRELSESIGFHVIDLGPLRNARLAEHIALAWIHLAMVGGQGRNIAFKVLGAK